MFQLMLRCIYKTNIDTNTFLLTIVSIAITIISKLNALAAYRASTCMHILRHATSGGLNSKARLEFTN